MSCRFVDTKLRFWELMNVITFFFGSSSMSDVEIVYCDGKMDLAVMKKLAVNKGCDS